jgi:hypothetical protein
MRCLERMLDISAAIFGHQWRPKQEVVFDGEYVEGEKRLLQRAEDQVRGRST